MGILSNLMGGVAQKQKYDAQAAAYEANARVNENNARLAEASAQDASDRGKVEENRLRKDTAQLRGRQEAGLSASGVDLTAGSAGDVLSDTRAIEEEDAAWVRHNAQKEKWGFLSERQQHMQESSNNRASAKNAKSAGKMALIGSLASSAAMGAMEFGSKGSSPTTTTGGSSGSSLNFTRNQNMNVYNPANPFKDRQMRSPWRI